MSAVEASRGGGVGPPSLDPDLPLIWRRTVPLAPYFELLQGDRVIGDMEPASMYGMDATGECLGSSLELRLDTSLFGGVRVGSRASMEGREGPSFRGPAYAWGRIRTPGGEVMRWRHAFTRMYTHLLFDARGEELLRLRPTFLRFGRTETRVILSRRAHARPDLPELLLVGWFLRVHGEAMGRRIFRRRRGAEEF